MEQSPRPPNVRLLIPYSVYGNCRPQLVIPAWLRQVSSRCSWQVIELLVEMTDNGNFIVEVVASRLFAGWAGPRARNWPS